MKQKIIKWTARVLGTLFAAFWLFMLGGYAIFGDPYADPSQAHEGYGVAILGGLLITSVVLAWFKPKIGGIALVVLAVAFSIFAYFTAGHNHLFAVAISGGPYFIVGLLFLASLKAAKAGS